MNTTTTTLVTIAILAMSWGFARSDVTRVGPTGAGTLTLEAQDIRACDLLDLTMARGVVGPDTEHPGGDTERETCVYANPGVAMLTIQIGRAELFDQIRILEPHTPESIGDRGRSTVQPSGSVALQFVKGEYAVTIGVSPLGGAPSTGYLTPLRAAALQVADRLR